LGDATRIGGQVFRVILVFAPTGGSSENLFSNLIEIFLVPNDVFKKKFVANPFFRGVPDFIDPSGRYGFEGAD